MGLWQTITSWWNRDKVATAELETGMTQPERDVTEEDYQGRKDDSYLRPDLGGGVRGGYPDFERDSHRPDDYNR